MKHKLFIMRDAFKIIALLILSLSSISAYTPSFSRVDIGCRAPKFRLVGDSSEVMSDNLAGNRIILNFWNSSDVESRLRTIAYDRYVRDHRDCGVVVISVNTDAGQSFVNQLIANDRLSSDFQFSINSQATPQIIEDYLQYGPMKSFLIDSDGIIAAVNPDLENI